MSTKGVALAAGRAWVALMTALASLLVGAIGGVVLSLVTVIFWGMFFLGPDGKMLPGSFATGVAVFALVGALSMFTLWVKDMVDRS